MSAPPPCPTALLVDDEPRVRALAAYALRGEGYAVLEAGGGDEALRVVAGRPAPVDLLVTDVSMPGMGGPELAARLAGTRVLFVSGSAESAAPPGAEFLAKPFTPSALAARVREVLGRRG